MAEGRKATKARLASPGGWGQVADARTMLRYSEWIEDGRRRRAGCKHGGGCTNRATHRGMVNGLCMTSGCEFHVARWASDYGAGSTPGGEA